MNIERSRKFSLLDCKENHLEIKISLVKKFIFQESQNTINEW